jgi:hypothetical protein
MNERTGELHEISAEIGALKKSIEFMTDMWKTQEASATAGRRSLHEKVDNFKDEIRLQMQGFSLRLDRVTDAVARIEPSAESYQREQLRDEGAKRLGVKLYAAMVAGASVLGFVANHLYNRLFPPQ